MKNKKGLISAVGIVLFVIGFVLFTIGATDINMGLPKEINIIFIIFGIVFLIAAIVILVLYLNDLVKSSKELTINEADERNVMIRGKAAVNTMFITVFMMLALEFLLIILKETLAALLVSAVMFFACFLNIIFIAIYQKKM